LGRDNTWMGDPPWNFRFCWYCLDLFRSSVTTFHNLSKKLIGVLPHQRGVLSQHKVPSLKQKQTQSAISTQAGGTRIQGTLTEGEGLSTFGLLVLTSLDQQLLIMQTLILPFY
jgi:hypothetical protein